MYLPVDGFVANSLRGNPLEGILKEVDVESKLVVNILLVVDLIPWRPLILFNKNIQSF